MKNFILSGALTLCVCGFLDAQNFIEPIETFSKKKTAYITLQDGTELEGEIDKVRRKKGLIRLIVLEFEDGSEREIKPEEVKYAFLPQNGWDKFASSMDNAYDLTDRYDDPAFGERMKDGYGYFQLETVKLKRSEEKLLMQLVNPHFGDGIQVFQDPYAWESASMSVGGFKVAGGIDKSYFIKVPGNNEVFKVKKSGYMDDLEKIYGDCEAATDDGERRVRWSNFATHIKLFQDKCLN